MEMIYFLSQVILESTQCEKAFAKGGLFGILISGIFVITMYILNKLSERKN